MLKDEILFANIKDENGMNSVHEARFVGLITRFDYMTWNGVKNDVNPSINHIKDIDYFQIELAGIGILSKLDFDKRKGMLYSTEKNAIEQKNNIYDYRYNSLSLNWTYIQFNDLNTYSKKFSLSDNPNSPFRQLYPQSWFWDGTRAVNKIFSLRFRFDLVNNTWIEFPDCNSEFNSYKLYATKEMCESDNTPKIVRFENNSNKKVEKVVKFEITTLVKVDVSDVDENAIVAAMDKIRNCDDEILIASCVSCTDND